MKEWKIKLHILETQREAITMSIQTSKSIDIMNNLMPLIYKIIWNGDFFGKNNLS